MVDEDNKSSMSNQEMNIDNNEFILFLILILLLMGNQNTFNTYFNLLDEKVTTASNIFNALSATAEGLKGAFETPQKVMNNLKF